MATKQMPTTFAELVKFIDKLFYPLNKAIVGKHFIDNTKEVDSLGNVLRTTDTIKKEDSTIYSTYVEYIYPIDVLNLGFSITYYVRHEEYIKGSIVIRDMSLLPFAFSVVPDYVTWNFLWYEDDKTLVSDIVITNRINEFTTHYTAIDSIRKRLQSIIAEEVDDNRIGVPYTTRYPVFLSGFGVVAKLGSCRGIALCKSAVHANNFYYKGAWRDRQNLLVYLHDIIDKVDKEPLSEYSDTVYKECQYFMRLINAN